eukprot:EG_transcript_1174
MKEGGFLSVCSDTDRALLAVEQIRASLGNASGHGPDALAAVRLSLDFLTIIGVRPEVRRAVVQASALPVLLDAADRWGGQLYTPASRCLAILTMPCSGPHTDAVGAHLTRLADFAARAFAAPEGALPGQVHAARLLTNLALGHAFDLQGILLNEAEVLRATRDWSSGDRWAPVAAPSLHTDDRVVFIAEEEDLVNRVHEAVVLLRALAESWDVPLNEWTEQKLRWLLLDHSAPLPAARAAAAVLQRAGAVPPRVADWDVDVTVVGPSGVNLLRQPEPAPRVGVDKAAEDHAWYDAILQYRQWATHQEERRGVTPEMVLHLFRLAVQNPALATDFGRLFSLLPVPHNLLSFALHASVPLHEEVAVATLRLMFENVSIPEGSFLRTAAAARQLSRLLRSPYPSVKAGVVALMAKAAKYQHMLGVVLGDDYLATLLTNFSAEDETCDLIRGAECPPAEVAEDGLQGLGNCPAEDWVLTRERCQLGRLVLALVRALLEDNAEPRGSWAALTQWAPRLEEIVWSVGCSQTNGWVTWDLIRILVITGEIGPRDEDGTLVNLCTLQTLRSAILSLPFLHPDREGDTVHCNDALHETVTQLWRFTVQEREKSSPWMPIWGKHRAFNRLLRIGLTCPDFPMAELAVLAVLEVTINTPLPLLTYVTADDIYVLLELLRSLPSPPVAVGTLMLLSYLLQDAPHRAAFLADGLAIQAVAQYITAAKVGTLADVISMTRNTYSLALYPLDLVFKLLHFPERADILPRVFDAAPDLESRLWKLGCSDDLRVREYIVNITGVAGRLLVDRVDAMVMQACRYMRTVLPHIAPGLGRLQEAVATSFANRTDTKDVVYQLFKFTLEHRKHLPVLTHRLLRKGAVPNLVAVIEGFDNAALSTELAAHTLAVLSTLPEYHPLFMSDVSRVARLLDLPAEQCPAPVQVVILNVLTELLEHAGCRAALAADSDLLRTVGTFIRDDTVQVVKDVQLGRGVASFAHYSTLFFFKLLHSGSVDPQALLQAVPGVAAALREVGCHLPEGSRPQVARSLDLLGQLKPSPGAGEPALACSAGPKEASYGGEVVCLLLIIYMVGMYTAYGFWDSHMADRRSRAFARKTGKRR